jgi:hypothetical protein
MKRNGGFVWEHASPMGNLKIPTGAVNIKMNPR